MSAVEQGVAGCGSAAGGRSALNAKPGRTRTDVHKRIPSQILGHLTVVLLTALGCATTASRPKAMDGTQEGAGEPELAQRYLADSSTPATFKDGIRSGIVVIGMCPLQAFAAAGLPGPYMVRRDRSKWSGDIPPPEIIEAQCKAPDESVVEVMFRNKTQFASTEPKVFRVRFVAGKAVLIDQKGFKE